jgi:retron-type reverse transcriptase
MTSLPHKLTIDDCLKTASLESSALYLVNKIAFDQKRGYTKSTDGETYWEFGAGLEFNVNRIKAEIASKSFRFGPCHKIVRRIKQNKVRDVYISSWRDRIVERWLNDCLNKLLNGWFSPNAYAYRIEELGLDSCQNEVARSINPYSFIVKRDISNYFYTIDHGILLAKLAEIIDERDYLYELVRQRIQFGYVEDGSIRTATIGIPFGASVACTLANIYLTDADKVVAALPVKYFRYADDFLIVSDKEEVASEAARLLDSMITDLKLTMKPAHYLNACFVDGKSSFTKVSRFKYLGLEFTADKVKLAVEKQRKVMNFFKRGLEYVSGRIKRATDIDEKLKIAIKMINTIAKDRIRSVAIIDYYIKHMNDENQLRVMDRLVAEMVISCVLGKKFRQKDFRVIPYEKLRKLGLISMLHRHRLYAHGHLRLNFMSLHNELITRRFVDMMNRRKARIDHMKMSRKIQQGVQLPSKLTYASEHQARV